MPTPTAQRDFCEVPGVPRDADESDEYSAGPSFLRPVAVRIQQVLQRTAASRKPKTSAGRIAQRIDAVPARFD